MSTPLFSSSWYRVADLKPALRLHVDLHRHSFRGRVWYVLEDHASGRFHRFTPAAHTLIGLMDGERTVDEIWKTASERLGDDLPTQDEVVDLLGKLHGADAMICDVPPDVAELSRRSRRTGRSKIMQSVKNPLAIRIPVLDPDRFLTATMPLVRPLLGWPGAVIFCLIVGYAAVLAGQHYEALTANAFDRILATQNLALMLISYPVIKALHELGHCYAVKRWGGEVHDVGIMFLVFMPVPYVDASASAAFRSKWRRAFVAAAGIVVEALIAAIALIVWVNAEPGLVRAVAFNAMVVAGLSTLLFNGNPLLRFDGYFVLADLVEIPNLGSRCFRYVQYLIQRYLFGARAAESPVRAPGERGWFLAYAVLSLVYRMIIMVTIVFFVATKFFMLGVALALWALVMTFGVPLTKALNFMAKSPVLHRHRARAWGVTGGGIAALVALMTLVPLPAFTVSEGVLWLPADARVHAEAAGFVERVLAPPRSVVAAGAPLIALGNPDMAARRAVLDAEIEELELSWQATRMTDLVEAAIIEERLKHARTEQALIDERLAGLTVRAGHEGRFVLPEAEDMVGRWFDKGEIMAYLVAEADPMVRLVIGQRDIDRVRSDLVGIEVRPAADLGRRYPARILRETPAATTELPSAALSTEGGGDIYLDPRARERLTALSSLFQIDLALPPTADHRLLGGRMHVRFRHRDETMAERLWRLTRQVFLRRLNV